MGMGTFTNWHIKPNWALSTTSTTWAPHQKNFGTKPQQVRCCFGRMHLGAAISKLYVPCRACTCQGKAGDSLMTRNTMSSLSVMDLRFCMFGTEKRWNKWENTKLWDWTVDKRPTSMNWRCGGIVSLPMFGLKEYYWSSIQRQALWRKNTVRSCSSTTTTNPALH